MANTKRGRRTYGQACPIAHALDMIGERWALLVVRELRLGPRRYVDLQAALPGVGPSVLAQRLRDLERVGVLHRRALPAPAAGQVYELTEWGAELEPVFAALRTWGLRSPVVPLEGDVSADTVFLGLKAFFDNAERPSWSATYAFRLERESYNVRIDAGRLSDVSRGEPPAGTPDVIVSTDFRTLQTVLNKEQPLSAALDNGALGITGDSALLQPLIDAVRKP